MAKSASNPQIVLRPQDLVVLLRLSLLVPAEPVTYAGLAAELGLTASEIHAGVGRASAAQLTHRSGRSMHEVNREALRLFVQHGARYCFPATHGPLTRGMPTSYAAAPLKGLIATSGDPVPVWPHKAGTVRGAAFYPLYPTVPEAAARNPALYELLSLFDAIRGGTPRDRALAIEQLDQRLKA